MFYRYLAGIYLAYSLRFPVPDNWPARDKRPLPRRVEPVATTLRPQRLPLARLAKYVNSIGSWYGPLFLPGVVTS